MCAHVRVHSEKEHFCLITVLIRLPLFYRGCHGFKLQTGLATTPAEQMHESVIQSRAEGDKRFYKLREMIHLTKASISH